MITGEQKQMKKERSKIFVEMQKIVNDYFPDYYWMEKRDDACAARMIKQLEFHIKNKQKDCTTKDVLMALSYICNQINKNKPLNWFKINFSIPILNSKLNEIIATIKSNAGKEIEQQIRVNALSGRIINN